MYPRRRDGHSYDSMEARALESEARNVTGNSRMTARAPVREPRKKKIFHIDLHIVGAVYATAASRSESL